MARATACKLLWSEYTSASAQINLRQNLTNLRHLFAPFTLVEANYQPICLNLDPATVWCDASAFTALVEACRQHEHRSLADCALCLARLQEAVALAQGGLLENLLATSSAPFDDWLADQRARFAADLAEA